MPLDEPTESADAAPGQPGTVAPGQPAAGHVPVLAGRVAELLAPVLDGRAEAAGRAPVLIDATLGLAGHTTALLAAHPSLHVIGIDRDPDALARARRRVSAAGFGERFTAVHAIYDEIATVAARRDPTRGGLVDGILFDLGVSSMQLDQADRGFAYAIDAPLDMRMDPAGGVTAADVVNTYAERDLARILRDYGEERFAARIARAIARRRARNPLGTSGELVEVIRDAIPAAAQRGGHPAKRTFQALRVEVNDELGALRAAIPAALATLRPGGRIVVMSYQSLEDRIVKHAIAPMTVSTTPLDLPVELEGHEPTFRWLTRKAERADEAEIQANPRAAAARLRAAERRGADS